MKQLGDLLEKLKTDYLQGLEERAVKIDRALTENDWKQIIAEFHKLKGTGKTYGFPQITNVARICEEIYENNYQEEEAARLGVELILSERNSKSSCDNESDSQSQIDRLQDIRQSFALS